ncbi:MAG: hypothetical protein LBT09_07555 [Planctomycetaceae bacterium]|jgi:hypothetical protein|nr:hypothetical protein [Planctomycetaceae bacterium]
MRLTIVTLVLVISLTVGSIYPASGLAQSPVSNQEAADRIANSLASRFPNYDIVVRYRNGQLQLQGEVGSEAMIRDVNEFVRNINGVTVNSVNNQLQIGRRGVAYIPPNPNSTPIISRNIPSPVRTAPVLSPDVLSTLSEAAPPEIATPNSALTRRYGNDSSLPAIAPAPMPVPARTDNRPLLIASADPDRDYSSTLPPPLASPLANNESGNYPPITNVNNTPIPNSNNGNNNYYYPTANPNNNYPSTPPAEPRPRFRPAMSTPMPLYPAPANANNNARYGAVYVANNPNANAYDPAGAASYGALPAPTYGAPPYYGATGPMPSAYNRPYLPPYAWPSYAAYPNYAAVSYPRSYSVQAWPYIGPFYPYPQAPLGWRQVTLKYDHARWWLDFNDGEPSGPLSPLFRQPTGYRY